jgi:hypothetical protein
MVIPVTRTLTATKTLHLLMQSVRICILCIGFAMELFSLRSGNFSGSIQRHPYQCVFEMMHHNLRERGTLMLHSLGDRGRHSVWDEEGMLDTIHYPSTSTRHIS